ncbi:HNH endonuclease [Nocardia thailandica]|uniref:HNH endonuclease n=1 Tax=Nocardia thailandica TaxID=257275 RepID=UPI000302A413|nr:HNH endonuclease [Nocardia thailandica]
MSWSTEPGRYRGVPRALADDIRARDQHTCQAADCGAFGHEVDHITPVSAGGTDDPGNLRTLCAEHHRAKTQAEAAAARAARQAAGRLPVEQHPGLIR